MSTPETQTIEAPAEITPAPAQAPATPAPAETAPVAPSAPEAPAAPEANQEKSAAPALTPEQDAQRKQLEAQAAIQQVIKDREDKAAVEIQAVCDKYGCELIVGHSVKVRFRQQGS